MSQVQISLKQWIKTGKFGPINLGMSSDEVRQQLGPPPEFREKRPMIWKYGGVEIYFDRSKIIDMIFIDDFFTVMRVKPTPFRGGI